MKLSFGNISKQRTKRLFEMLHAFADDRYSKILRGNLSNQTKVSISSENLKITVKATLKELAEIINIYEAIAAKDYPELYLHQHVKQAIEHLDQTVNIFYDKRKSKQGAKLWHFTVSYWFPFDELHRNMTEFDIAWAQATTCNSNKSSKARVVEFEEQLASQTTLQLYRSNSTNRLTKDFSHKNVQSPSSSYTPFQVPHDLAIFVGREKEIIKLKNLLLKEKSTLSIVSIYGMGGVGKSTLAIHFSYLCKENFSDGVLWADLRTREPATLLDSFAQAYGEDIYSIKSLSDKADKVQSILATKKSLLILDNAEDSDILAYLLPKVGTCSVIVTARDRGISYLQGFPEILIEPFSSAQSKELVLQLIGSKNKESENSEIIRITELCGNLALALNISGSLIKFSQCSLKEYRIMLEKEHKKLDIFQWRCCSIRSSLNLTWETLSEELKLLLSALSIFWSSSINLSPLAATLNLDLINVQIGVGKLSSMSLVKIKHQRKYELHPLVKEFAAEKLILRERQESDSLYLNLADFYINIFNLDRQLCYSINAEYENIIGIIDWLFENSKYQKILDIGKNIIDFLILQGYWNDGCVIANYTILSSQKLHEIKTEFDMRLKLSEISREQANYAEAQKQYEACQAYFESTGQQLKLANVIRGLGELDRVRRNYVQARKLHLRSLSIYEEYNHEEGKAQSLHDLGLIERILGNSDKAISLFEKSLVIHEYLGNALGRAYNHLELGIISRLQGGEGTKAALNKCLAVFESLGDKRGRAYTLRELGELAVDTKNYAEAEHFHQLSLTLRKELGDQRGKTISLYRIGRLNQLNGKLESAKKYFDASLAIADQLDDKLHKAFNLVRLGELNNIEGNLDIAIKYWEQSQNMFGEMQVVEPEVQELNILLKR